MTNNPDHRLGAAIQQQNNEVWEKATKALNDSLKAEAERSRKETEEQEARTKQSQSIAMQFGSR